MTASPSDEQILVLAQNWLAHDPDPETREELAALLAEKKLDILRERVAGELEFGTAGLRAVVGAGPMRMNRAVVRRTTRGVAEYLLKRFPDAQKRCVVVGYDARLSSFDLAQETVGVFVAAGIPVRFFKTGIATPIVAWAQLRYDAIAAVIVTASHNPPEYNGYKLYDVNGAQIVPPVDSDVAQAIRETAHADEIPCDLDAIHGKNTIATPVDDSVIDDYFARIAKLRPSSAPCRDLGIVYTAMHGVGAEPVLRALKEANFSAVYPVAEQVEPDGNFPTVRFPNPEEPGALDLSLALAEANDAEIVIANDPDVDRLAVAGRISKGEYRALTGNQIGILLADYMLSNYSGDAGPIVAQSLVSSPMLRNTAKRFNARYESTLTGFKWVWNAALDISATEKRSYLFGFEEALGYSIEDIVHDKDGVSAALVFAEMTAALKERGLSIFEHLGELYRKDGFWVSTQVSLTKPGASGAAEIASAIEKLGANPPKQVGTLNVSEVVDYRSGEESRPRWLHNSDLIELRFGENGRLLVRPSGTEPKIKFYVDLCLKLEVGENWIAREADALKQAKELAAEVIKLAGLS